MSTHPSLATMIRWLVALGLGLSSGFTPLAQPAAGQAGFTETQAATTPRRVNIPAFYGTIDESQAAIFWFGRTESSATTVPGRNYVDVRMAYSVDGLYWRATGIDYYLWYRANATESDDLTRYDALALYVDTGHNRASAPQTSDYYFLVGLHGDADPNINSPAYHRQGHGTGSGWTSAGITGTTWLDYGDWQWSDTGPNNNGGNIDYGWVLGGTIPWSVFGLSAPPAAGTVWGMGMLMYDQDNDPSQGSAVQTQSWPETFNGSVPGSWGELRFGLPTYQAPTTGGRHSVMVRSATPTDHSVADAWMGGAATCSGGQNGHGEDNHGNDSSLLAGSEIQPTHFPCFNKSYLRFPLSGIPAGKVILSATVTLYQWGSAGNPAAANDDDRGHDSYLWLSSVSDAWDELAIQWNNAPLAQQNFSRVRVATWPANTPIVWPGVAYTWDATQAVATAYAAGQPLNVALYDSATGRNTSKYFTASQVGLGNATPNWDLAGRPRLDIVWGDALGVPNKQAQPTTPHNGDQVSYSVTFYGTGRTLWFTDKLPGALSAPLQLSSSYGAQPTYNAGTRQIQWSDSPPQSQLVTLTYLVTVQGAGGAFAVTNNAQLGTTSTVLTSTATIIVDGQSLYLPLMHR